MPVRNVLACTMILAGALACSALSLPSSHAAGPADRPPTTKLQPVFDFGDDEERAVTRDLRPTPDGPGYKTTRPRVTLRPSSPVVRIGAPISFELGSSEDGFAHVYVVSASGRVQVWLENEPIVAGQHKIFPTRGQITAAPPVGREDIVLVVTRERIKGFLGHGSARTPRDLDYDAATFKEAVRERFEDLPRRDWGYARALVQVVNRAGPPGGVWDWDSGEWQ